MLALQKAIGIHHHLPQGRLEGLKLPVDVLELQVLVCTSVRNIAVYLFNQADSFLEELGKPTANFGQLLVVF